MTFSTLLAPLLPKTGHTSPDGRGRDQVQAGFLLLASLLSGVMFLYRLWDDGWVASTLITLACCLSLLALQIGFRRDMDRGLVADLSLLILLLVITGVASQDQGLYSRVMMWLPAAPLIGNFFGGRIHAFAACVLVTILLLALALAHSNGLLASHRELGSEWARFVAYSASTLLMSATAYLYEQNRRQADAEKQRLAQLHRQWVAVVSHELRTPLTALRGALALRSQSSTPIEKSERALFDIALRNTDRLVRLVDDLLDMERINSGNLAPVRKRSDIATLLNSAAATYEHAASERGISIAVDVAVTEPVRLDPDRIEQVIHNLLSNAIKFSPDGSQIHLRASVTDQQLHVEVADAGPGITTELAQRLFQPFSQGDDKDDRKHGGFGLGLSICKAIIDAHGGHIGYRNRGDGGCSFYFDIPLTASG